MTICYVYNDEIYKSRIPLLGKTKRARLWFHDEVYSEYNWTIEPEITLDELYTRRAKQLREKYDNLILMYSGGTDSHQVLRSFIDNSIHLDEIHTLYPLRMLNAIKEGEYPDGYNLSLLKEYDEAVIPRLKHISIFNQEIKVKVWDITEYINIHHLSDNFMEDNKQLFGVHNNKYKALQGAFMYHVMGNYIQELKGTTGLIFGFERPTLITKDGILYFYFTEIGRCFVGNYEWDKFNCGAELFYWCPEVPEIPIKQSHCVFNFLKKNNVKVVPHRDSVLMKKLLYPSTFEPEIYQQPLDVKHRDDDILRFIYGRKEADNIKTVKGLKILFDSKYYEIGRL